jgi:cob(I)alamin adenosyltransferase
MSKTSHHSRVGARKRAKLKKWSGKVTRESHALDLENGVFKKRSAHDIARSLKRSAERSHARKSAPLRSAMSMLTFYINRAGKNMSAGRKRTLEAAKDELRRLFA